jgi:DNA-binding beta-propeller fold protein YncE
LNGSYIQTILGSGFRSPWGVAVDGSGNVYVADAGFYGFDGGVYKETLTNGSYVQTLIGSGWGAPFAVAVDASGTVYVAGGGPGGV